MAEMKTIRFPGSSEVYEIVDAAARNDIAGLKARMNGLVDDTLSEAGSAADAKATGEAIDAVRETANEAAETAQEDSARLKIYMEQTAPKASGSGTVVTIGDNTLEAPLADLVIYGKSVQSAAPSTASPADIVDVGKSGKIGVCATSVNLAAMERGAIDESGAEVANQMAIRSGFIPVLGEGLYCSKNVAYSDNTPFSTYNMRAYCYDADKDYIGSVEVLNHRNKTQYTEIAGDATLAAAAFLRFVQVLGSGTTAEDIELSITFGDAGGEFPAYAPAFRSEAEIPMRYSFGLPGIEVSAGEHWNHQDAEGRYWACDIIDFGKGTLTRRVGMTTFRDLLRVTYSSATGIFKTTSQIPTSLFTNYIMTRIYESVDNDSSMPPTLQDGQICAINAGPHVQWKDSRFTSVDDLMAAIGDEPIYYLLKSSSEVALNKAELAAYRSLMSAEGTTKVFTLDPMQPELEAAAYIDTLSHIDEYVEDAVAPIRDEVENIGERVDDLESYVRDMSPLATIGPADIISITDAAPLTVEGLTVNVEAVQNKHGYDAPWPAGGGKNLLEVTAITSTIYNVKFTVNNDGTINISGTPTANIVNYVIGYVTLQAGNYKANGFDIGAAQENRIDLINNATMADIGGIYAGNTLTFSLSEETTIKVVLILLTNSGAVNTVAKPMIFRASETDATFAPYSNICPITGWNGVEVTRCGKNLLNAESPDYADTLIGTDGSINISQNYNSWRLSAVGTFTLSVIVTEKINSGRVVILNSDNNVSAAKSIPIVIGLQHVTFSLSFGQYALICIRKSATDYQLELGSTATDYEPYQGNTYDIAFPTEAGTVYGGTVDLVTGECMVTHVGNSLNGGFIRISNGAFLRENCATGFAKESNNDCASSMFEMVKSVASGGSQSAIIYPNKLMFQIINGSIRLLIYTDLFESVEDFNDAISITPLTFYVELASPIPLTPLTPAELELFKGVNNISADAGKVTVQYRQDVFLALNNKINELQAIVVENG